MNKETKKWLKFATNFTLTVVGVSIVTRYYNSKKKIVEVGKDAPIVFPMLEGDITIDVDKNNGTVIASMSKYADSGDPLMIVREIDKDIKRVTFDDGNYIGLKQNLKDGQYEEFSVTTEYTDSVAFRKGYKSRKVHYAVVGFSKEEFNRLKEEGLV